MVRREVMAVATERDAAVASAGEATRSGADPSARNALDGEAWLRGDKEALIEGFAELYRERPGDAVRFAKFVAGRAQYEDVLRLTDQIEPDARAMTRWKVPMLAGHARLALQAAQTAEVERAFKREQGGSWLGPDALLSNIRCAMHSHSAFSFVRLGDGEARFLVHMLENLRHGLTADESDAIGDVSWFHWFGTYARDADAALKASLLETLLQAVSEADVLGVSDAARLRTDNSHFGYLAAQERWVRELPERSHRRFTDAFAHHQLNQLSPFLAELLNGLDFLGVVSPHPELASRLRRRFDIGAVSSHTLPGDRRLVTHAAARAREPTLPDAHDRILRELSPPRQGALYLVAAGLLGKIYCGRIRRLGGIALDIGSIADLWMGHDTRGFDMDRANVLDAP